ncbi:unnamed protein product, partial [marine sediment metagenome]
QTKEELFDIVDVTPASDGTFAMPEAPKSAEDLTNFIRLQDPAEVMALTKKLMKDQTKEDLTETLKAEPEPEKVPLYTLDVLRKGFRKEWINLKKGFPQYMLENLDRFKDASTELQAEALQKWMRLVAKGVIGDIPWPLAEPEEEVLEKPHTPTVFKGDVVVPSKDDKNWDAYKYLHGDADFENFKAAYENLGEEVYQNALKQLGWTAV